MTTNYDHYLKLDFLEMLVGVAVVRKGQSGRTMSSGYIMSSFLQPEKICLFVRAQRQTKIQLRDRGNLWSPKEQRAERSTRFTDTF